MHKRFILLSFLLLNSEDFFNYAEFLYYKHKDYYNAITEYKRSIFYGLSSLKEQEANLKIALCYLKLSNLKEGMPLLVATNHPKKSVILERLNKLPYKSKEKAIFLAIFLPGSGLFYANKPLDGLISAIFNFSLLCSFIRNIKEKDYLTSFISFNLFYRFYMGNIITSQKAVDEYNYQLIKKFFKDLDL